MNHFFTRAIKAGLLVGTLDISAAFVQYYIKTGKSPTNVLTYIASAVFGNEAFAGGNMIMLWGLIFHFCVALSFTFFFFLIFKQLYAVVKNKIIIAVLYGAFMWSVMQFLVLPLTNAPKLTFKLENAVIAILILIICIGIPLSFIAGKYHKQKHN